MQHELALLRTKERVRTLEDVLKQQSDALRESTRLLQKYRPPRPTIPHDRKLIVAAQQHWRCAGARSECPMWMLGDGTFTVQGGLFEVDHVSAWASTFRTAGPGTLQALCVACHAAKTRRERLHALEHGEMGEDGQSGGVLGANDGE